MIGTPGSLRMPTVRQAVAVGGVQRRPVSPALVFGIGEGPDEGGKPQKSPVSWLDRVGRYYEKLGVGGKVLFFLTVPGASVVILFMERKRLMALIKSWKS